MRTISPRMYAFLSVSALLLILISVTAGSGSARTLNGTPILIGNIGSYSGVAASATGGIKPGLTVWERWVNAHGGIAGHPVKITFIDDAGDPTKALTGVQELILQDHVVALLDPDSIATSWQTFATSHSVPTITANGLFGSGLAFSAGTTALSFSRSFPRAAHLGGGKSYALVYCAELAVCKDAATPQQQQAQQLGMSFTSTAVSGSAPDYTATCLSLKSAGVDSVDLGSFTNTDIRVAQDCARQSYHPLWVTSGAALSRAITQTTAMDGVSAVLLDFPWFESDTPATKVFQAALKKYAPGIQKDPLNYNANLSGAWAAGKVFEKAAAGTGAKPSTAAILKGLYTIKNDTFGGLTPPLTFAPKTPASSASGYSQPEVQCFFLIQWKNGVWGKPFGRKKYIAC
jgi:branched-chain amino acid transport system substrate-binding protein